MSRFLGGLLPALLATTAFSQQAYGPAVASGGGATASAGDCASSYSANVLTLTCTKSNGVVFAPSATIDATNAANITTGVLLASQIPTITGSMLGVGASLANIGAGGVTPAYLAAGAAAGNLGYTPAHAGANSDITALSGLTAPLSVAQGGTGSNAAAASRAANSAATTTTSTTAVMAGMGSAFFLTPARTGKVLVTIACMETQAIAGATNTYQMYYGTGTAPTNGAALTGTAVGSSVSMRHASTGLPNPGPTLTWIITGLTVGTAYWFDLSYLTGSAGDAVSLPACNATMMELGS